MSRSIEERVVQMEFENASFEKKAAQTKKTLQDLDKSLEFKNGRKSFEDVEAAAEKTNFESLISAADTVTSKLSNLGIIGVTALTNLTNKAANAGEQLVKSLTIDQLTAGWAKMDQITKSSGTLISQGYNMDEVESQLERLNWFTDETSYNLTDMVDNISKFTATGAELTDSVTAMQGIALWAANAGQNASTASKAMFQLSQAMSGYLTKQDWVSIQNANMDTVEFRQTLLDTAVELGTLQKNIDGTYTSLTGKAENFALKDIPNVLTEGAWATADVQIATYKKYGAAVDQLFEYAQKNGVTASQAIEDLNGKIDEFGLKAFRNGQEARTFGDAIDSVKDAVSTGWMNTFKTLFGNYEQQKELWTNLSETLYNVFAEGGNERNLLLSQVFDDAGREMFIGGLSNILDGVIERIDKVKEVFNDAFGPVTADHIRNVLEQFRSLSEAFRMGDKEAHFLEGTLGAVFTIIKKVTDVAAGLIKAFSPLGRLVTYFTGEILTLLGSIGDTIKNLVGDIGFGNTFDALYSGVNYVVDAIINSYEAFWNFIYNSEEVKKITQVLIKTFNKLVSRLSSSANKISAILAPVATFINDYAIQPIWNFIKSILAAEDPVNEFKEGLKNLGSFFSKLWSGFKKLTGIDFSKWSNGLSEAINAVKDTLQDLVKFILGEKDTLSFSDILGAAGAIGAIVAVQKISDVFTKVGSLADTIKASFSSLNNIFKAKQLSAFTNNFNAIAKSIALLAGSLALLTLVDENKLMKSAAIVVVLSIIISGLALALGMLAKKIKPDTVPVIDTLSGILIKLAGSLIVISGAVWLLGHSGVTDSWKSVFTTLALIAGLAVILAGLTLLLSRIKSKLSVGVVSILAISISLFVMASAISKLINTCKKFNDGDTSSIQNNLWTIVGIIAAVIGISIAIGRIRLSSVLGIVGLIGVVILIMHTLEQLKTFSLSGLGGKLGEIIVILAVLGALILASVWLSSMSGDVNWKQMAAIVAGVVGIIGGMYLLIGVLNKLKGMTGNIGEYWSAIGGIVLIGLVCAALVLALGHAGKLNEGQSAKFGGVALALVGVVACIGVLVIMVRLMKGLAIEELYQPLIILGIISAIAAGLMIAIGFAAKLGGGKGLVYIIGMMASLLAVSYSLMMLQSIPWDSLWPVMTAVGVVLLALGALCIAFGVAVKNASANKGSFGTLIGAAVMLVALGGGLAMLSNHDWKSIAAACLGMAVVLIAVTVCLNYISKMTIKLQNVAIVAGLIVVLVAAVAGLAFAMTLINGIPAGEVAAKVAIILGILTGFVIVMGVLAYAAGLLPIISVGIVVIVALILSLTAAVLGFAAAMAILSLVDLAGISAQLGGIAGGLALCALAGILMIAGAIGILLGSAAFGLFATACEHCATALTFLIPTLTHFLQVIAAVGSAFGIEAFANLKEELLSLAGAADEVASDSGANIPAAQAAGIQNGSSEVTDAVNTLGEETVTAIEGASKGAQEAAEEGGKSILGKIKSALGDFDLGLGDLKAELGGKDLMSSLFSIPDNFDSSQITASLSGMFTQGFSGIDTSQITSSLSGVFSDGFSGIDTSQITSSLSGVFSDGFSGIDLSSLMSGENMDIVGTLSGQVSAVDPAPLTESMQTLLTTSSSSVDVTAAATEVSNGYSRAVANSMISTENKGKVKSSGVTITNEANSGVQSVDTKPSGAYIVDGIVTGINNNAWKAYEAAEGLAGKISERINNALQINSPSKVTMKSGASIVEGLMMGMNDNAVDAYNSAERLAGYTVLGLNAALNSESVDQPHVSVILDMSQVYAQIANIDLDDRWNPVIKPSLDMSDVNPAMKNIRAIVGAKASKENAEIGQNESGQSSNTWAPTFNQYNYSPKALSRSEIYRQTKNQFSAMKGVVKT